MVRNITDDTRSICPKTSGGVRLFKDRTQTTMRGHPQPALGRGGDKLPTFLSN